MHSTTYIGINILIIRDGRVLLGLRKNVYGAGTWGMPGGHLEQREKMIEAAARELREETGLTAVNFVFENFLNQPQSVGGHRVQVMFSAKDVVGEPVLCEPNLCEEWRWFSLDNLPENIFPPHQEHFTLFCSTRIFNE